MALPSTRRVLNPQAHALDSPATMNGATTASARPRGVELVVRLRSRHEAAIAIDRVPTIFGPSSPAWLGEEIPDAREGVRTFSCDLELQAGGSGPSLFRKAAVVSIGEPVPTQAGWVVPIEWRAASMSALVPVFTGQLEIEPEGAELDGRYAPPGGRLGHVLDVTLLGAAARQTGRWFLRQVAAALR